MNKEKYHFFFAILFDLSKFFLIYLFLQLKVADWLMTGHSEDNDDEKPGIPLNAVTTANAEDHVAKNDNSDEESNRYLRGVFK